MSQDVYLKSDFYNHLQALLPTGFTRDNDEFIMTGNDYNIRISFGYTEFYPHAVQFHSVVLHYRFHQVEQIFTSIFSNCTNMPFGNETFFGTFNFGFGRYDILTEEEFIAFATHDVYDDQSFNQIKPVLENLINEAISFKNQYNSLLDVYNYVESKGSDWWHNYRIPAPALRAIVRKVLNISYISDLEAAILRQTQSSTPFMTETAVFHQATKDYLANN